MRKMNSLCNNILCCLTRNGVIEDDEYEIYQYGIICFCSLIIPFIFAAFVGMVFGSADKSSILVLSFVVIRKFSGGYHARNIRSCLIASFLLIGIFLEIGINIGYNDYQLWILTIIATVAIIIISPIDSENRRLDKIKKIKFKKITIFLVIQEWIIAIILKNLELSEYARFILLGIVMTFVMQMPVLIKRVINIVLNRPERT